MKARLGLFCLILVVSSSCSLFDLPKTNKDLKENMDAMNKDMGENVSETDKAVETTKETKQSTEELLNLMSEAEARILRSKEFDALTELDGYDQKKMHATAYVFAFDFQVLGYEDHKNPDILKPAIYRAMKEFFGRIKGYLGKVDYKIDMTDQKSKFRRILRILSVVIHKEHLNQKMRIQRQHPDFTPITFLDLIKDGLEEITFNPKRVDDGARWLKVLRKHEDEARFLLELRYNFILAMLVGRTMIHVTPDWGVEVLMGREAGMIATMSKGPWDAALSDSYNHDTIEETSEWLDGILDIRDYFRDRLKTKITHDKTFCVVIRNLRVPRQPVEVPEETRKLTMELAGKIQDVQGSLACP